MMNHHTLRLRYLTTGRMSSGTLLLVCALMMYGMTGCSSTGSQYMQEGRQFRQLADLEPTGEVVSDLLIPPGRDDATFIDLEADGQSVAFHAQNTTKHDATLEVHFGDEKTGRIEYWKNTGDGALYLTATHDFRDDALSLFESPMLLMGASLAASASSESRGPMRVVSASNPRNEKATGSAQRIITYAGDTRLALGNQRVRCKRLEATFTANLSLATTETNTTIWISPEHGVVAFREHTVIRVLGITSDERTRHYVRVFDDS